MFCLPQELRKMQSRQRSDIEKRIQNIQREKKKPAEDMETLEEKIPDAIRGDYYFSAEKLASIIKEKEQLDVERLERRSLTNYFYQVVGKLDDKLTKEKKEAYEAKLAYSIIGFEPMFAGDYIKYENIKLTIEGTAEAYYIKVSVDESGLIFDANGNDVTSKYYNVSLVNGAVIYLA